MLNLEETLSFIITLEKVISAIFDRSFLKFGTLMVALLNIGLIAIPVESKQHLQKFWSAEVKKLSVADNDTRLNNSCERVSGSRQSVLLERYVRN